MSNKSIRWLTGVLAVGLCAATGAWAATNANLPPEQTSGAVTYMSGGIAKDQQAAMKKEAAKYALELEFMHNGKAAQPMSNVPVTIKDTSGKIVLDAKSDGPLMLAQLPDGKYAITAGETGKTETRNVTIAQGKHKTLVFRWKA